MKMTVKSGELMNLAKKALDIVFKGLDKCIKDMEGSNTKYDFNVTKTKDVEEDGVKGKYYLFEVGDKGTILDVTLFKIEDNEDSFMIRIEGDGLEKFEKGPIKQEEIEKYVTDYCDKYDLGAVEDSVDAYARTKISVSLQRVQGSTEDTIELTAINANCNASAAMLALDTVLGSEEFLETITTEPKTFDIVEINEDEYDVEPSESIDIDTSNTFTELFKSSVQTLHNIEAIGWGAKGPNMQDLQCFIESLLWQLQDEYRSISKWSVSQDNTILNALNYQYVSVPVDSGFTFEEGMNVAATLLEEHIKTLDMYYPNLSHEMQNCVDNWLRELNDRCTFASRSCTCSLSQC